MLRSLIGERDVALSTQDGFLSTPDSSGVNFYLPVQTFKALREGKGNALQKIQLIVLNMLGEQGIAEPTANGFHISAEDVSGMDLEQAEILRLPRRFPGRFLTSISGRTGNSNFRVALSVEMPEGVPPFPAKALISTSPALSVTGSHLPR